MKISEFIDFGEVLHLKVSAEKEWLKKLEKALRNARWNEDDDLEIGDKLYAKVRALVTLNED